MDFESVRKLQKVAIITGITGQDGAYLAAHLLSKGYAVYGSTRSLPLPSNNNLSRLGIEALVNVVQLDSTCSDSVRQFLIYAAPNEVYNLSGQSSVGVSFQQPHETWRSIELSVVNWLEAIRLCAPEARFFNAGSAECFGNVSGVISERTALAPQSPYAAAKAAAHYQVRIYRESFGLHASTGFLFNHESHLRDARFVTRKIVDSARRISSGDNTPLLLGNLDVWRDWGWAPEYVEAMWRMLQSSRASDYVIATGRCVSLRYFVELAFANFGLDWRKYVAIDPGLTRTGDVKKSEADPSKIRTDLGWKAIHSVDEVVALLAEVKHV